MSLKLDSAVGKRLRFGEFELAPTARTLWRRGEEIRLGSRALDILIALASRPGQILSKDDLTQLVWRGSFVDDTALRVGISAVRKALGNGGDRYIATVPAGSRTASGSCPDTRRRARDRSGRRCPRPGWRRRPSAPNREG